MNATVQLIRNAAIQSIELHLPAKVYDTFAQKEPATTSIKLTLSPEEHEAVSKVAQSVRMQLHELLWCGLDSLMYAREDGTLLLSLVEGSNLRFREGELPTWAKPSEPST